MDFNKFLNKKLGRVILMGTVVASAILGGSTAITEAAGADYPPVAAVAAELGNEQGTLFPIGGPNVNYEKYFMGKTFHSSLARDSIGVSNVTFTKGAHTYWHIHHGSCQILVPEAGRGYYQIWGQAAQELTPGKVVTIPENIKHWHGAAPTSLMQHLSIMQANKNVSTEWLEPVDETVYAALK